MERFHDLSFSRQPDGSIRLMQSDCGEDCIIDAHPEQLLFIARRMCGMKPEKAEQVADLERRIAVLVDKLQKIVCNGAFRSDLIERCGDGYEYLSKLDAVLDLALEFDGGRLEPEYKQELDGDEKPIYPPSAITQAKQASQRDTGKASTPPKTQEANSDSQMGLPV